MGSYICGVISKVTVVIIHTRALITTLLTTHEPPSKTSPGRDAAALAVPVPPWFRQSRL